jgi:hypothetical protein
MPGIAGPPTAPPLPPLEAEAAPSTGQGATPDAGLRWSWLTGALFGIAALVVKLLLWRLANPPAFYVVLVAPVAAVAVPLGGLLGAVLGALEKIQPQRHEDTKP